MASYFRFKRGETLSFVLQCSAGDPLSVSSVTSNVRATTGGVSVNAVAPVAAEAAVLFHPAVGALPAYWSVTVAPADSYGIAAGRYAIDAALVVGGDEIITDALIIVIEEPSTVLPAPTTTGLGAPWSNPSPNVATGPMTLAWGPSTSNTLSSLIDITGLPSAAEVALSAALAALTVRVAALEALNAPAPAPVAGVLDFSQTAQSGEIDVL